MSIATMTVIDVHGALGGLDDYLNDGTDGCDVHGVHEGKMTMISMTAFLTEISVPQ